MTEGTGAVAMANPEISPDPSDEEVAAIMAAVEVTWPRPTGAVVPAQPARWRFSGRWWSKPVPSRRDRP